MKKKIVLMAAVLALIAGGAFAQSWYDSYAPGVEGGHVMINAGVGWGLSTYEMGIPPISLSADFMLPIKIPLTVGVIGAFRTSKYDPLPYYSGDAAIEVTYTDIAIGGRIAYHFGFVKNLDTYAGVTLGYVIQSAKAEYGSAWGGREPYSYDGVSYFLWGANIGARYFFTKNIGAYLELGYSGLQIVSAGLSLKF